MAWQDHVEAIKAMFEAGENYLKRQREEECKRQEMLDNFRIEKERAEAIDGKPYIPPVVNKAAEIAEKKIKRMEEDEQLFRDTEDFAFELFVEEYWRPCPRCEMCPESGYGSFMPQWSWCKRQRGEIE